MENFELEDMKLQLATLQRKLDKQIEVNEKQVNNAIRGGLDVIRRKERRGIILCSIMLVFLPLDLHFLVHSSLGVVITSGLLMLFALFKSYALSIERFGLNESKLNLIETSEVLNKYKKNQITYLFYSLPIAFAWCGYFIWDLISKNPENYDYTTGIMAGALAGAILGLSIGYMKFYHPVIKVIKETNQRIEEMKDSEL